MEDYVEGPNPIWQYLEMKGLQPDKKFKKVDSIATGAWFPTQESSGVATCNTFAGFQWEKGLSYPCD